MVCEFPGELVEAVKIGVEVIVAVVRPDEPTVAKPLEDAVNRATVIVAPAGDLGEGSRLVEIVQRSRRSTTIATTTGSGEREIQ
jgi:hypothetical protein